MSKKRSRRQIHAPTSEVISEEIVAALIALARAGDQRVELALENTARSVVADDTQGAIASLVEVITAGPLRGFLDQKLDENERKVRPSEYQIENEAYALIERYAAAAKSYQEADDTPS